MYAHVSMPSSTHVKYEGARIHGDAVFVMGDGQGPDTATDLVCPMYMSPAKCARCGADTAERRCGVCVCVGVCGYEEGESE